MGLKYRQSFHYAGRFCQGFLQDRVQDLHPGVNDCRGLFTVAAFQPLLDIGHDIRMSLADVVEGAACDSQFSASFDDGNALFLFRG